MLSADEDGNLRVWNPASSSKRWIPVGSMYWILMCCTNHREAPSPKVTNVPAPQKHTFQLFLWGPLRDCLCVFLTQGSNPFLHSNTLFEPSHMCFLFPVFLRPRTAAEAWSTSTTRTQKQTRQRWCCPRQTTATPPSTTASRTASHPPTQPPQIETTSTPPPPLQPPSLLIPSRSVTSTINQSVASFIRRFPSFGFSSTQVFRNLEVIDSLKSIQTGGWVTLTWFRVSTGKYKHLSVGVFSSPLSPILFSPEGLSTLPFGPVFPECR